MSAPCPICRGTGYQILEREGREFAQPCACRKEPAREKDDFFDQCGIPPRYEHCSFASFETGNNSLSAALMKAMEYCNGYPYLGENEGLGLLFIGSNGVGKTHLAVSVLSELILTKGAQGRFWDFHALIREIRRSYDPETHTTEDQVLQPVIDTDILLLDDLGAWKMTDWMVDTLFYVLNRRYMAKRATLVTTNFEDVDRASLRDADALARREFLVERIGPSARSRLLEMCQVVRLEGPDFRQACQSATRVGVFGGPVEDPKVPIPPPRPRFGG